MRKLKHMKRLVLYISIVLVAPFVWAQQPKDTLHTEIVNVVKPYKPTISDAFKIKDNPEVENPGVSKMPIQYSIQSAPVASTFTPSKGKAKKVSKAKREHLFDNFVSVGFGNYTTPLVEAYLRNFPDRYSEFGAFVKHHSSQGSLKDVYYNTSFYNSGLDVYYKQTSRDVDWKISFDVNHLLYHWYGTTELPHTFLDNFNPKQSYLSIGTGGKVTLYDSFLKEAEANLYYLSDYYKSSEVRFKALPVLEFPVADEWIRLGFDFDYLTGSFLHAYSNAAPVDYTHINIGMKPAFVVLQDDLQIHLGAKVYANTDHGKPIKIYAYPDVNASYQLIPDILTVFAGATGGMYFNTYRDAIQKNPYMSPTHDSQSTNEKYRAFGGIKGKLASNIGYLFKASYADERNKALEVLNPLITSIGNQSVTRAYELENSFSMIYDDVTTLKLHGEINIDFTKEFSLGGNLNLNSYTLTTEKEPWNLPAMTASVFADYHREKWHVTSKVFAVGERKEKKYSVITKDIITYDTVKAYVDLNLGLSYAFSSQLSAFVKGHNLLGTSYSRFYNYPTQGAQVLGGVIFKFDM